MQAAETAADSDNPGEKRVQLNCLLTWQPKSFMGSETQESLSKLDGEFNYREGPPIELGGSCPQS